MPNACKHLDTPQFSLPTTSRVVQLNSNFANVDVSYNKLEHDILDKQIVRFVLKGTNVLDLYSSDDNSILGILYYPTIGALLYNRLADFIRFDTQIFFTSKLAPEYLGRDNICRN